MRIIGNGWKRALLWVAACTVCWGTLCPADAQTCQPQWQGVGSGMNANVYALAVMPNGDLVAGGWFTAGGGVSANSIARWNGSSWSPLGSGLKNGAVVALAVMPNGDLVAGGGFSTAGGVSANYLARWNGSSWSPLGTGMNSQVDALAVMPNGDLVAGGDFTTAGGVSANRIARWNGSFWSPLGTGMNDRVYALAVLPNGDLVAGGSFTTAGGVSANRIARWNGTSWSPLGTGIGGPVLALAVLPNGDPVAGGAFTTAGGLSANYIAGFHTRAVITQHPGPFRACVGGPAILTVEAPGATAFRWQRETAAGTGTFADLFDGPAPSGALFSGTGTDTLIISDTRPDEARLYRVRVSDACGPVNSNAAMISVCAGDWNCDGTIDFNDFLSFLNDYNAGNPRADLNADGAVDFNDFLAFLNAFNAGC